jgi:U3 small nucleolar RNA-associated protein 22
MESAAKRRKLHHPGKGLFGVDAESSPTVSNATTFVLQTDELLREVKLDYSKSLPDIDSRLHKLRETIDSFEPHGPIPVGPCLSS